MDSETKISEIKVTNGKQPKRNFLKKRQIENAQHYLEKVSKMF